MNVNGLKNSFPSGIVIVQVMSFAARLSGSILQTPWYETVTAGAVGPSYWEVIVIYNGDVDFIISNGTDPLPESVVPAAPPEPEQPATIAKQLAVKINFANIVRFIFSLSKFYFSCSISVHETKISRDQGP